MHCLRLAAILRGHETLLIKITNRAGMTFFRRKADNAYYPKTAISCSAHGSSAAVAKSLIDTAGGTRWTKTFSSTAGARYASLSIRPT